MKESSLNAISEKNQETNDEGSPIRKGLVFTIVALALLMTTVDSTIVATALDTLQRDLHTTVNWVGWILTGYAFGLVVMLPISAKLSIRFGHRRVFLLSVAVFTVASLCCGLSSNIFLIIVVRIIQAIGGAGITPSVTGIIVDHFGSSRDRAVSFFGSIFPIGAMIGPIFGGLFVTYWTWRGIFFINAPIGILVILLSFRFIPADKSKEEKVHAGMDITGITWLAIGLLTAMLAASYLGEAHAKVWSPMFIGLLAVAVITIAVFFRHIRHVSQPFIAPRFIYGKGFGSVNLLNAIFGGITLGAISLVPLYAINHYGMSALDSGTLLVAEGIASIGLSAIITMLLRRTGYRLPLYIGCSFIILGVGLLSLKPVDGITPYIWLAGSCFLIGVGIGLNSPPARNAGLQLAPEDSATIAALRTLCLQMGQILMIAIATAVIAGNHPGNIQAHIYMFMALLFIFCLPLVSRIPEHKGAW
jgi:EmrB/QacA subfamily drug resistance transporter